MTTSGEDMAGSLTKQNVFSDRDGSGMCLWLHAIDDEREPDLRVTSQGRSSQLEGYPRQDEPGLQQIFVAIDAHAVGKGIKLRYRKHPTSVDRTMRKLIAGLVAPLMLAACAATPPAATTTAAVCTHDGTPPVLRADLPANFDTPPGHIVWPANDGFEAATVAVTIQPGALLDRYGDGAGNFLSPKGTGYRERALPYVCRGYAYTTYRVVQPLPVLLGTAAPWFAEPGGAVQVKTTDCVKQLLAEGVLLVVPDSPGPACPAT